MRIVVALLCGVLAACGGGGDATEPSAACTVSNPLRIQLFGDSTQEGWDGQTQAYAPIPPAAALQAELEGRLGPGRVVVTSRAVDKSTASDLAAGTDGLNAAWPAPVDADIVIINHGINDATHGGSLADYRAALDKLAQAPALVIFETPNIIRHVDLAPWAQAMREVAAQRGVAVADTYAYTAALPDWQALVGDWAHPTQELYLMIARDVLAPTVVSLACR
jgi:lysophospholipase L1-like esterase